MLASCMPANDELMRACKLRFQPPDTAHYVGISLAVSSNLRLQKLQCCFQSSINAGSILLLLLVSCWRTRQLVDRY